MYLKLRGRMKELDVDQEYLAQRINLCRASLSSRMTGRIQWQANEMYAVMDVLSIPYCELHEYFPKDGRSLKLLPKGA